MLEACAGEIRCVPYDWVPYGWARCHGQLLPIAEFPLLFEVIKTTYGGDGVTTFALPDLRGRIPIGAGSGGGATYKLGQQDGKEVVWLDFRELPAHSHMAAAGDGPPQTNSPGAYLPGPGQRGRRRLRRRPRRKLYG